MRVEIKFKSKMSQEYVRTIEIGNGALIDVRFYQSKESLSELEKKYLSFVGFYIPAESQLEARKGVDHYRRSTTSF